MVKNIGFICVLIFALSSCKIKAEDIDFGKEQCHFCKMNIVDKQHAAQFVTKKGKQFKFDAIECMINQIQSQGKVDLPIVLVAEYGKSKMIDAKTATYLISPEIKSPMGAFLSAFSTLGLAEQEQKQHGGELYTWEKIKEQIATK